MHDKIKRISGEFGELEIELTGGRVCLGRNGMWRWTYYEHGPGHRVLSHAKGGELLGITVYQPNNEFSRLWEAVRGGE